MQGHGQQVAPLETASSHSLRGGNQIIGNGVIGGQRGMNHENKWH